MFFVFLLLEQHLSLETTNEARVLDNFLFVILLCPEICEGVNNDAKYEVEDNNDDYEEEEHVIDEPQCVEWLRA